MRICAILTVRNEAAFLLEWLAHHRAAGITDVLVFSNDCEDGTTEMLDRLQAMGELEHHRNDGPYHKSGIQFTALKQATQLEIYRAADWILALDIDEFVNVHVGDHTLPALIDALPEASAIALTWRLFGNADQVRYKDTPVTRTFTRAAPEIMYWPWRASMFKTLFRNDGTYGKPGIHRPRDPDPARLEGTRWFDGHGRELPAHFRRRRIFSDYGQPNYGLAQLNHYPLGWMESYVLKADRGRAVHADQALGLDYWVERNFNQEEDTSITALDAPMQAELARLRRDPELARLHDAAVLWRKARFESLLGQDSYRALFGRLLMTQPSRPVTEKAAALLITMANRAAPEPGD
ncbi:glycosyltransferase family 2 protein [Aquicoccus sp. SCR17]|nr:glycosyltransferase family 2 protein [Carideicomes alvinocaridis]